MQITQIKNKIIERIVQNEKGQFFRAYFLVCERNGRFYGKLIRVEPIFVEVRLPQTVCGSQTSTKYLPVFSAKLIIPDTLYLVHSISSSYFSTIETFFVSQMTRAPSIDTRL